MTGWRAGSDALTGCIDTCVRVRGSGGRDFIYLKGWLVHPHHRIASLSLGIGGGMNQPLPIIDRPDVAAKMPHILHAMYSGYQARIALRSGFGKKLELVFTAILNDGRQLTTGIEAPVTEASHMPRDGAASPVLSPLGASEQRQAFVALHDGLLDAFLNSSERLSFYSGPKPLVSVVLVLWNQAGMSFGCLRSLLNHQDAGLEIIIVDNASSDATGALLDRVNGARIIRNAENRHYLRAVNQGAAEARGEYLLLLNNDTVVLADAIARAAQVLKSVREAGAVGGRLIRPDGFLQEAGSSVLSDGSTLALGRGEDPCLPKYSVQREVDYCSAAFLMTRLDLWRKLGGFDEMYAPAYYEDVDYCFRLREEGHRIVYEPRAFVIHCERASSKEAALGDELILKNKPAFAARHARAIPEHNDFGFSPAAEAAPGRKLLMIDDLIPRKDRGQGCPRSALVLNELSKRGFEITFLAVGEDGPIERSEFPELPASLEIISINGDAAFRRFLDAHVTAYDMLWVSRSPNMKIVQQHMRERSFLYGGIQVVYDSEAIFALRSILEAQVKQGTIFSDGEIQSILRSELEVAATAHTIVAVSEHEGRIFRHGYDSGVFVLGYADEHLSDPFVPFDSRHGFFTVGPVLDSGTPNADGLSWLLLHIFPLLEALMNNEACSLTHAGRVDHKDILSLHSAHIRFAGPLSDLGPLYRSHRVFVAPTRYAAGIPLKVIEAASHGIPIVATPLVAEQLGWRDGEHLLTAKDAHEFADKCYQLHRDERLWACLRDAALKKVGEQYSRGTFSSQLDAVLEHSGMEKQN